MQYPASTQACLSVDADLRPTAKRCFQIIRASNAGEDAAELQPTFSPSHLSAGGSSASLSALTIDRCAGSRAACHAPQGPGPPVATACHAPQAVPLHVLVQWPCTHPPLTPQGPAPCSIAEPIVGGTYSAPTSYLGSAPGSVRANSDSAANGAFGAYPPGPGSTGGSWDWSMAERLPRCLKLLVSFCFPSSLFTDFPGRPSPTTRAMQFTALNRAKATVN